MNIMSLVIIAMIGEAVWESFKMIWQQGKLNADRVGALIVGIVLAFSTGLDMFQLLEIPAAKIPFLGIVLTGVLISRGANFMHNLLGTIDNFHKNTKG